MIVLVVIGVFIRDCEVKGCSVTLDVVVEAHGISKFFGRIRALVDVSFELPGRSLLLLLGPNGSGKSTLIDIVCGFRRASSGRILVLGVDPWLGRARLADRVACLPDRVSAPPWVSCYSLLRDLARARGVGWGIVREVASELGVTGYWGKSFISYSAGMRRKCLLAAVLATGSELIVVDEPFNSLDAPSAEAVARVIREAWRRGSTVIVATHIIGELGKHATHIGLMMAGRLRYYGRSLDVAEELGSLSIVGRGDREALTRAAVRLARLGYNVGIRGDTLEVEARRLEEARRALDELRAEGLEARIVADIGKAYESILSSQESN